MSTFLDRINMDDTSDVVLKTGTASYKKKLPKNQTFYINTVPIDRHRFSHFSKYLNGFTYNVNKIFVDSCRTDCRRQLNYTHGKNVNRSDDLFELCSKRCDINNKNHQGELDVKYTLNLTLFYLILSN